MKKIKKIFKKFSSLNFRTKLRIISLFFIFSILIICSTAFFRTYTEYVSRTHNHGIIGDTVYINDADSDWYYYTGQNYTYSDNGMLPTMNRKEIYDENNLVETTITYNGTDLIRNQTGFVSLNSNEQQSNFIYYKFYPVNNNGTVGNINDDYILIELIDNPYGDRPNNLAFNGWVSTNTDVVLSYDSSYYERYAKVPVTYTNDKPNAIDLTFHANWIPATTSLVNNNRNWSTAIGSLNSVGMQAVDAGSVEQIVRDMDGYYNLIEIYNGDSCEGYYDEYGVLQGNNCVCSGGYYYWSTCSYYESSSGEAYDENNDYYELSGQGYMVTANEDNFNWETIITYNEPYNATTNMAGFYKSVILNYGVSQSGYYNSNGQTLNTDCPYNTCTVYDLVQYENGLIDANENYYYLVTRDTNILVMTASLSNNWAGSQQKPFTLTTMNNGTHYSNVQWTVSGTNNNGNVKCSYDTRIEYIRISSNNSYAIYADNVVPNGSTSNRNLNGHLLGNWHNIKLGRGILQHDNYSNFRAVLGGSNGSSGSRTSTTKYKLIIESGFYTNTSLTNGADASGTVYTNAKAVYGNDYDRVAGTDGTNVNDRLMVYYCASGSWGSYIYGYNALSTDIMFDTTIKSGTLGQFSAEVSSGVYIGGRYSGSHYSAVKGKVEGGYVFNFIGGPESDALFSDENYAYMYMTGGTIDMITAGAGETATYGNRIVQVTGGTVNYSVFGGSNGSQTNSTSAGTLRGSGYLYIGGNAVIGNDSYVNNNSTLWGAEAGSVFGIGNGKSGVSWVSVGSSDNSYIVIADNALIKRSVYGGGNYGAVGVSSVGVDTETKIKVIGGTINDSIYGGGNNNGSGNNDTYATILIEMMDGVVNGNVYGGSNALGTIYGPTTVNIYGGTVINNVYGGGQGGYFDADDYGTFVLGSATVNIGHNDLASIPTIGSVYGGSAYGSVNGNSRNSDIKSDDSTTVVNVQKGNIVNVFGGGQGGNDGVNNYIPYVHGDISVNIFGGTIDTVYGGNDLSGLPSDDLIDVNVSGGTITNGLYGGGKEASVKGTDVDVTNGTVKAVYGGGFSADVIGSTDIYIANGNITGSDNPEISGSGSVYGGCDITGTVNGSSSVTMVGGRLNGNLYGGGKGGYLDNNNVGTYILGDSHVTVGNNNIDTVPTIIGSVYGGSAYGSVNGNDRNNTSKSNTYDTTVTINKGNIGNVFGGGQGGNDGVNNYIPYVDGDIVVNINGGTINHNVYGGSDLSGIPSDELIEVNINNGTITESLYGGGNIASVKGTDVNIKDGTITTVYGGGFSADVTGDTSIYMEGGMITTGVYGGSNIVGTVSGSTNIDIIGGTISGNIYGGGKGGYLNNDNPGTYVVRNSSVTIGNVESLLTPIINGTIYGGSAFGSVNGNHRSQTTQSSYDTIVTINKGSIETVFGGGQGGSDGTNNYTPYVEGDIIVDINGGDVGTVYGGNDLSGIPNMSIGIIVDDAEIDNIYGGGNRAISRVTSITVNSIISDTNIDNIYGGGYAADIRGDSNNSTIDANVIINDGEIGNIFGGSNSSGVVTTTNVYLANNPNIIVNAIYGGNNIGGTTNVSSIDINGGTIGTVYGGSYGAYAQTGGSTININDATITNGIYGGGEQAYTTGNITMNVTDCIINGEVISTAHNTGAPLNLNYTTRINTGNIYGGGNRAGVMGNINLNVTNTTLSIGDIYGGGNAGGVFGTTNLTINNSNLTGTNYITQGIEQIENSNHQMIDTVVDKIIYTGSAYGGGNAANVKGNTTVDINGGVFGGSIFGGGDAGSVGYSETINGSEVTTISNTNVTVTGSEIHRHIFAGGNGRSAVVNGNTSVTIDGNTIVGTVATEIIDDEEVIVYHNGNVFGSGNEAATGLQVNNSSTSTVNIVSGTYRGNVYGGANTARVYGRSYTNIGKNAVNNNSLTSGVININGTVFGGGEANASGSQIFDWSFISVTKGIDVLIDGAVHDLTIGKSIFGSGNASSSGGISNVIIRNYGTHTDANSDGIFESFTAKRNVSIQRANTVVLDNCVMELEGIADRTDEYYSDTPFSIARVDQLKIKNNTYLFLHTNTNLLKRFTSVVTDMNAGVHEEIEEGQEFDGLGDYESFATATINPTTHAITRNVDNRLYVLQGDHINIFQDSNGSTFGPVDGMTFFGMYVLDRNNGIVTGMYKPSVTNGSTVLADETSVFDEGAYVMGLREAGQDIAVDGFYSYYIDDTTLGQQNLSLYTDYITPVSTEYSHKWVIGSPVMEYVVELVASKYSTLGTEELFLEDFSAPNTKFYITGFNFNDLDSDVNLLNQEDIPRIASSSTIANNNMGLVLESSNTGWITDGTTTFITSAPSGMPNYLGTLIYDAENSDVTPSLLFYLYHSKNLSDTADTDMGTVTISLQVEIPINDISSTFRSLNIVVDLNRAFYTENYYEGAITAGKRYEMFANTTTNISSSSSVSAYFSLYAEDSSPIYQSGYKHVLLSNFNFPENTKITMIDYANSDEPEYYYYVVTAQDVTAITQQINYILYGEASYDLSKFIRMGSSSIDNHYDDAIANANYQTALQNGKYRAEEEYIFIIDYGESNITTTHTDLQLLMELRNSTGYALIGVLDRIQQIMFYDLYADSNAVIDVTGAFENNNNTLYVGKTLNMSIDTDFIRQNVMGAYIYDTNYFDQKLGLKITITMDQMVNGVLTEVVQNGYDLLGLHFVYNDVVYNPRIDGSYRFNIAERVANVHAYMTLNAINSNLASGNYHIKIESFGSSDGIYYGLVASDSTVLNMTVVNATYGLDVSLNESANVIDKDTGENLLGGTSIICRTSYNSVLANPSIRVSLYRRDYTDIYSTDYELVDLNDYLSTTLTPTSTPKEYLLLNNPPNSSSVYLYTKPNLRTGTYKLRFSLYDSNSFIGEVSKYIFIK